MSETRQKTNIGDVKRWDVKMLKEPRAERCFKQVNVVVYDAHTTVALLAGSRFWFVVADACNGIASRGFRGGGNVGAWLVKGGLILIMLAVRIKCAEIASFTLSMGG